MSDSSSATTSVTSSGGYETNTNSTTETSSIPQYGDNDNTDEDADQIVQPAKKKRGKAKVYTVVQVFNSATPDASVRDAKTCLETFEDNVWKKSSTTTTAEAVKIYYSCQTCPPARCPRMVVIEIPPYTLNPLLVVSSDAHDHTVTKEISGLPYEQRTIVIELFSQGITKPNQICIDFSNRGNLLFAIMSQSRYSI